MKCFFVFLVGVTIAISTLAWVSSMKGISPNNIYSPDYVPPKTILCECNK